MPDLATLMARAAVLLGIGWFLWVVLCIVVQGIGPSSLEPVEDDDEDFGVDDTAEWDRARDRQIDDGLWPVSA